MSSNVEQVEGSASKPLSGNATHADQVKESESKPMGKAFNPWLRKKLKPTEDVLHGLNVVQVEGSRSKPLSGNASNPNQVKGSESKPL
eukprot:1536802-Karenia_brevis.AAC.1